MSDDKRDDIARRIRALHQKTVENGCTEAEAIAAIALAGKLMAQYRLTQSDLEFDAEPIDQHEVARRQAKKMVTEDFCIPGIRRYCGVKCWFSWRGQRRVLIVFGKREDTLMAEWYYTMIGTTIMAEAEVYKKQTAGEDYTIAGRRQMVLSFRRGMSLRINERLIEMAIASEPTMTTGSGTALVPLRNQLVDDAYGKLGLRLRQGLRGARATDGGAYMRGRDAGDRVNLNRPVGTDRARGYLN